LIEAKFVRSLNREGLSSLESMGVRTLSLLELQRKDAHSDQVASVNSLIALGNDCFYTEEVRASINGSFYVNKLT
jgi:hypothetical protein